MTKYIELSFKDDVYYDWKTLKKVIEAVTNNKLICCSEWKTSREGSL